MEKKTAKLREVIETAKPRVFDLHKDLDKSKLFNLVWNEQRLAEKLDLPIDKKSGQSKLLSDWIKDGLPYIKVGKKRLFLEEDIMKFLWKFRCPA